VIIALVIVLVMTVVMSVGLKALESMLTPMLNYDKRWSDPEYVKLIHKTRESERTLGFDLTECECADCTNHYNPVMLRNEPVKRKSRGVVQDAIDNATKPDVTLQGSYRIDAAGPGFLQFKITEQMYRELPRKGLFGEPKKFMGMDIIKVDVDYRNQIVYLRTRHPGPDSNVIEGPGSIIAAPRIGNEVGYK